MITEIVTFGIKAGMSREEVVALYEKSVPAWEANPKLVHKSFLYCGEKRIGGGVYLWKTVEAARNAHGNAFQKKIRDVFGSTPQTQLFESPVVINNYGQVDVQLAE